LSVGASERATPSPAGRQYYEDLCMKAVNQCVGRAIRHRGDYAAIVLVDARYATPEAPATGPCRWVRMSSHTFSCGVAEGLDPDSLTIGQVEPDQVGGRCATYTVNAAARQGSAVIPASANAVTRLGDKCSACEQGKSAAHIRCVLRLSTSVKISRGRSVAPHLRAASVCRAGAHRPHLPAQEAARVGEGVVRADSEFRRGVRPPVAVLPNQNLGQQQLTSARAGRW